MAKPMTQSERNKVYLEVVTGLMNMKVWQGRDESFWDLPDPNIKKYKIMLKLYLDYGKEFSGDFDIDIPGTNTTQKLTYALYNDRNKNAVTYVSEPKTRKKISD